MSVREKEKELETKQNPEEEVVPRQISKQKNGVGKCMEGLAKELFICSPPGVCLLPFICPSLPLAIQSRGPTWQIEAPSRGLDVHTPFVGPWAPVIPSHITASPRLLGSPACAFVSRLRSQMNRPAKLARLCWLPPPVLASFSSPSPPGSFACRLHLLDFYVALNLF